MAKEAEKWIWNHGDTCELNFKIGKKVLKVYLDKFEPNRDYTYLLNAYLEQVNHEELIGEKYKLMVRNLIKWEESKEEKKGMWLSTKQVKDLMPGYLNDQHN